MFCNVSLMCNLSKYVLKSIMKMKWFLELDMFLFKDILTKFVNLMSLLNFMPVIVLLCLHVYSL